MNFQQRMKDLNESSERLESQIEEHDSKVNNFAKDLEIELNKRRKKYKILVDVDVDLYDPTNHTIDFFIVVDDRYREYVCFSYITDEFDENEILKLLDEEYEEIKQRLHEASLRKKDSK